MYILFVHFPRSLVVLESFKEVDWCISSVFQKTLKAKARNFPVVLYGCET